VSPPIRLLVLDGSAVGREVIRNIVERVADIELSCAPSAAVAVARIRACRPDVILLALDTPGAQEHDFLREVTTPERIPIVACSASGQRSREARVALDLGAVDVISMPETLEGGAGSQAAGDVVDSIRGAATSAELRARASLYPHSLVPRSVVSSGVVVAVGVSTGGPDALRQIVPRLPANCPPVLVVQHMVAGYTAALAESLDRVSAVSVTEGSEGEVLSSGKVFLAPSGCHMEVVRSGAELRLTLNDDPPVGRHRPSVNVLFNSVARAVNERAVGVILTGMGEDGADGLLAMKNAGAYTLGQSEESCAVYGMPRVAEERGAVRRLVSLEEVAGAILHHARQKAEALGA